MRGTVCTGGRNYFKSDSDLLFIAYMLKIEHLRKHFGNKEVLVDVNLEVNKGEVMAIIGQSGHGKSVILKTIMGLIIPDGGRIIFENEVISSPTMRSEDYGNVRNRFGMLFQGAALFDSMNVGENIGFPLRERTKMSHDQIKKVVEETLEMVGLRGIENVMPSELSGGMRSRVGLARAIAMNPEVMLYDEPTSALDPIMSDKINDLIIDMKKKMSMTSIVVTHDMASAYKVADKIAMLYDGKIIFHGSPAEIRASRNPYIQQFIKGQRKLYYAVEEEESYKEQVDLGKVRLHVPHRKKRTEYDQ